MSNLRFEAVSEASKRKPVEVTAPSERPSEFFGKKVFNQIGRASCRERVFVHV